MPRDKAIELLERALELPEGSLSPGDAVSDRWDSITLLGFMAAVDEEFGVVLAPQRLLACKSAGDVANLVHGSSN